MADELFLDKIKTVVLFPQLSPIKKKHFFRFWLVTPKLFAGKKTLPLGSYARDCLEANVSNVIGRRNLSPEVSRIEYGGFLGKSWVGHSCGVYTER